MPLAISLKPELVTFCGGGGNDIMVPNSDPDALAEAYEVAVADLRAAGCDVVIFTGFDTRATPLLRQPARQDRDLTDERVDGDLRPQFGRLRHGGHLVAPDPSRLGDDPTRWVRTARNAVIGSSTSMTGMSGLPETCS